MPVRYHLGKFPPSRIDWEKLIPLIGPASAALARYDGLLSAIPNAHVLLSPLTTQEAVLSSKIEGTQVTMGEVLEYEAGGDILTETRRGDAEEILNYRQAMNTCIEEIKVRPFSQHMLRAAHAILMQGVRGRDKSPGAYRTEQNWIGNPGSSIDTAGFIPIAPEHLQSGMDAWERYFNDASVPDILVHLAILHLEFEALHPFKDGNGRLGRMIVPLYLHLRKRLHSPDFYISGYFEANREEYLDRLRSVSRNEDWTPWCAFFLNGVRDQAVENEKKATGILQLYERIKQEAVDATHSQYAIHAVDYIFKYPIFTAPQFILRSRIPKPTASRILRVLSRAGTLHTLRKGKGRQASLFAFGELLNIVENREIFVSHG